MAKSKLKTKKRQIVQVFLFYAQERPILLGKPDEVWRDTIWESLADAQFHYPELKYRVVTIEEKEQENARNHSENHR